MQSLIQERRREFCAHCYLKLLSRKFYRQGRMKNIYLNIVVTVTKRVIFRNLQLKGNLFNSTFNRIYRYHKFCCIGEIPFFLHRKVEKSQILCRKSHNFFYLLKTSNFWYLKKTLEVKSWFLRNEFIERKYLRQKVVKRSHKTLRNFLFAFKSPSDDKKRNFKKLLTFIDKHNNFLELYSFRNEKFQESPYFVKV